MTDIQRLELQRKLNWLHKHQPNNWQAIQALESKLHGPITTKASSSAIKPQLDSGLLDEVFWHLNSRVLDCKRQFAEWFEKHRKPPEFPRHGGLAQFGGYCLFLKDFVPVH